MADYKKMYFTLLKATEKAINTLVEAQRECEELFISSEEEEEKEKKAETIKLIKK